MDIVILVFVTILIGSCMQRVSGMGVGLLGAPVLSIVMGPVDGVMVINALAAVNAALSPCLCGRTSTGGCSLSSVR